MSWEVSVGRLAVLLSVLSSACGSDDRQFGQTGDTGGTAGSTDAGSGGKTSGGTGGRSNATGGAPVTTGGRSGTGGSPATGGSAGTGGASGGAGGVVTDGGGPDGFDGAGGAGGSGNTPIQSIQDGTVAAGETVTVGGVFVTAARQTTSGAFNFYMQEPQGKTTAGHAYPEYAAADAFMLPGDAGPNGRPSVGDCVEVTGRVGEFRGNTQLVVSSWRPASTCGGIPQPLSVPNGSVGLADIATDTDLVTAGNQPGALAERYEGVLVRVRNVRAVTAPAPTSFPAVEQSNPSGPTLLIDPFFYSEPATAGQDYASITGIFSEFDRYILQPRSAGDIVR
jgi:hypothetical protein